MSKNIFGEPVPNHGSVDIVGTQPGDAGKLGSLRLGNAVPGTQKYFKGIAWEGVIRVRDDKEFAPCKLGTMIDSDMLSLIFLKFIADGKGCAVLETGHQRLGVVG